MMFLTKKHLEQIKREEFLRGQGDVDKRVNAAYELGWQLGNLHRNLEEFVLQHEIEQIQKNKARN